MNDTTPSPDDLARDLRADLEDIARHEPTWKIPLLWEKTGPPMAYPEWDRFRSYLPLVARVALRRAIAAEVRVVELEAAIGVCVPSILRVFIQSTDSEIDREVAQKVLDRVQKAMEGEGKKGG